MSDFQEHDDPLSDYGEKGDSPHLCEAPFGPFRQMGTVPFFPPDIERYCDGTLSAEETAALERRLRDDPEAMEFFVLYMEVHSQIAWNVRAHADEEGGGRRTEGGEGRERSAVGRESEAFLPPSSIPPIILDTLSTGRSAGLATVMSPGGFVFSYVAAAILLGIGLLVGWAWKTSHDDQTPMAWNSASRSQHADGAGTPVVGRVTGMVDCVCVDREARVAQHDPVALGQKYALASGFMEVTYDTGAKVILQGPAIYEVDSTAGGFLSLGKLTARVESQGSRVEGDNKERDHSRLSTLDSRLFSIRTPTAVVTDLGTEFGVEVDKSGTTKSHVFQGTIEVQSAISSGNAAPLRLGADESAVVDASGGRTVQKIRAADRSLATAFVRRMPEWAPIEVFSTGLGLRVGDTDPHWQIVARRGAADFKPQAAVVTVVGTLYVPNEPLRGQWISLAGNLPALPAGWYTFRTTFELGDASPASAVLQGWFMADNHIDAIRLNGRSVPVPEHGYSFPFDRYHSFRIGKGFVRGTNVLEVEVFNAASNAAKPENPMALLMELKAVAVHNQMSGQEP